MPALKILPCLDSPQAAEFLKQALEVPRDLAARQGHEAVDAIRDGFYVAASGAKVDWSSAVRACVEVKVSVSPDAPLPKPGPARFVETQVEVANETTFSGASRLVAEGFRPLALNFANGISPGGGFLSGARAQEEALCRSSALFATLEGDAMYKAHSQRPKGYDSTDWAILSPSVQVFRSNDGKPLDRFWILDFISSAAPVAKRVGKPESARIMETRIRRILAIARAYGHEALVLGAWGCGAFGNDGLETARTFRAALEGEFAGAFAKVVFSVTDWSTERSFLGPFRDTFRD
ncbi:MAG: TIGR02452 family protein [Spirochaetota bacterium]